MHFLRCKLSPGKIDALKRGADLAAGVDHEKFQVEIRPVAAITRRSLVDDLDQGNSRIRGTVLNPSISP